MTFLPLTIVAALGRNRVIGAGNALPWRLGSDLARFKAITLGKPIVMGRKTFESIGRPLPGRTSIVVSRQPGLVLPAGVLRAPDLEAALVLAQEIARADGADEVIVGGGAEIYAATIARADRLRLTEVAAAPAGEALFPAFNPAEFVETFSESHPAGPRDDHAFRFVDYRRRTAAH